MKILMLVPFLPNAQTSGGQTRWYNLVKFLSENHEITLFSLIKNELEKGDYDLIHAEAFYVMPHIPKTKIPSIQVEQTIWHKVYEHHVKTDVTPILRPFLMIDVFKLKFWEIYFWKKATKLCTVS